MEKLEIETMTLLDYEQIEDKLKSDFDDFWSNSMLKSELMGENKQYIVAKYENCVVGFAGVMILQPEMEIMNIVTKKSERGKGIGRLLLEKIMEIAQMRGIEKILLEVNSQNSIAKNLYEKAGFVEVGLRKNYYASGEDAILMSKKVNNL